jgi:hypothetical protein
VGDGQQEAAAARRWGTSSETAGSAGAATQQCRCTRLEERRRHLLRYTLFPAVRPISVVHAGTTHTGRTTPAVSNETTASANVAVIANSRPCRIALVRVARWHAEAVAGEGLAQRWPRGAQLLRGGVGVVQLLGQRVGPARLCPVGGEAAGLPAHSLLGMQGPTGWRRRWFDQRSAVGSPLNVNCCPPRSAAAVSGRWC